MGLAGITGVGRVLVLNAGSSSVKLRSLDAEDRTIGQLDLPLQTGRVDESALTRFVSEAGSIEAIGHRVVHGGSFFAGAVRLDRGVVERLRTLVPLAPLHQSVALAGIEAIGRLLPDIPAVACFDTAFHASLPEEAATYALPADLRRRFGLRRFGFHGLSHAYAARRGAEVLGAPPGHLRVVTCHLGAGASLAAVNGERSVDTTMGFTPLEGLIMATRSGSVDPGLLLWLVERGALSAGELARRLEEESGLLGLCGTSDMRQVLLAAARGQTDASLALGAYIHRLRASIATMAAAMDGMDALVFTGGVGENSSEIRRLAAEGLGFLGVRIDSRKNEAVAGDREIGIPEASVRALVVASREDLQIAREVRQVLGENA